MATMVTFLMFAGSRQTDSRLSGVNVLLMNFGVNVMGELCISSSFCTTSNLIFGSHFILVI